MFNLADIDKSIFTTDIEKFCFAILNLREEVLEEGNGFHVIDENGIAGLENISWESDGPTISLTDEEISTKVSELFHE